MINFLQFADAMKLLGVTLYSTLAFNQHVTNVVCACTYRTLVLRHIRPLLTVDAAKIIASAIITGLLQQFAVWNI